MRIEELKQVTDRRPFEPFLIRTADGREIQVRHPDAIACDSGRPRIAVSVLPGGGWDVIDIAQVTSLGIPAPAATGLGRGDAEFRPVAPDWSGQKHP